MPEVDMERAYEDGALRPVTKGEVAQRIRLGRSHLILEEVAVPLARLVNRLREEGETNKADTVLAHAVHDGVAPSMLAAAFIQAEAPSAQQEQAEEVPITVGPNGQLRAGAPPEATDTASAIELVNWLRNNVAT